MLLLVLSAIFCTTLSTALDIPDGMATDMMKEVTGCIDKTKIDFELLLKLKEGVFEDNPKVKEFLVCLYKNLGGFNGNNELQTDFIKQKMQMVSGESKIVDEIVKKCVIQKKTPEETAFECSKCVYNALPEEEKKSMKET
ncbi:unnamed protein product [Phyllotreta striolata]|uniref:Uncharacterized protein n=1 Tax=Phyllotreta striolata TaxID=444603 RepID=A0A9N9XMZ9_PHYSR|nr:unnamed protein product [Phyllotreta striolata]